MMKNVEPADEKRRQCDELWGEIW